MFCKNCGKEVADNAYVFTGCGCLINDGKVRRKEVVEGQSKKGKIAKILLMVSFGFFCCSLFWRYFSMSSLFPLFGYAALGAFVGIQNIIIWFCSCLALSVAIPAFIFGLKAKEEPFLKMLTILNLMLTLSMILGYTCNIILSFL